MEKVTSSKKLKEIISESQLSEASSLKDYLEKRGYNYKTLSTSAKISHGNSKDFDNYKKQRSIRSEDVTEDLTTSRKTGTDIRSKEINSPTAKRERQINRSVKHYAIRPVSATAPINKESVEEAARVGGYIPGLSFKNDMNVIGSHIFNKLNKNKAPDEKDTTKADIKSKLNGKVVYRDTTEKDKISDTKQIKNSPKQIEKAKDNLKLKNEEIEQLDELGKRTLARYIKKAKDNKGTLDFHKGINAATIGKGASMPYHLKSKKRSQGIDRAVDKLTKEENEQIDERKKQLMKSARMIKSLYKRNKMTEETYDWEKEDKSVKTYGKKPKFDKSDEKSNVGENKPTAVAILSGGTTLTGSKRDVIEIDPAMRNRPGQPEIAKKDQINKNNKDK